MNLLLKSYHQALADLPSTGRRIVAYQYADQIVVYQAYKQGIARYAVDHQQLGGPEFSLNRMSWIKTNFLWMMYRSGWAGKENQERVLALHLPKSTLVEVLEQAAHSSFTPENYPSHEAWQGQLAIKPVRLQWDPEHDALGNKLDRRAIQLGLKGDILQRVIAQTTLIEDITDFVIEQKRWVDNRQLEHLQIPAETIYRTPSEELNQRIGLS
jgi:hypothetical protein